ncbi:TonB-dependent receptor [Chitinophagaceae bacterium LB-8]|uniref:TonB-dependent receptor n=1 Tax=Paraflavisolibacter caeni TaxID=2982496 RepID=A0A9X2Y0K8_9BACT|nr:TonB-dependent receptor [Paraflavisolibacter caeni]MCU7552182.1 TonB-dependent receptor [Paraflavisolibacter caeni]
MFKRLRLAAVTIAAFLLSIQLFAQVQLTGTVRNSSNSDLIPSASITVKGTMLGTLTDDNGNFKLTVPKLPVVLVVSSVGFMPMELNIENGASAIKVSLKPGAALGEEVVVSASRMAERILESPVTIERMSATILRTNPTPNYYEGIQYLKGVDMHTASLTFRTVTTRGFVSSGNTRLNQLIDGMDNQAPGLNFSVGNVIGLTELDVDNIELLSGASSALYGSGGMNGTLLINGKNPFTYQGLSFQAKQGAMHFNDRQQDVTPFYNWSLRYGKSFNNKFAFKIAGEYIKADDWQAYDYDNVLRSNVRSKVVPGDRQTDPNYDGVNVYGDETSQNMYAIANLVQGATRQGILNATNNMVDIVAIMNALLPSNPTQAQLNAFINGLPPQLQTPVTNMLPFYYGLRNQLLDPSQNVSRTGYLEKDLVDYNTENLKVSGGVYYKFTPGIEASFNSYVGTGTTVYTGADRYSLKNLKIAQHKLEVKSNNWFIRGYTTQENAGDSYNSTVLGRLINESWKSSQVWYPQYIAAYVLARSIGASDAQAHNSARSFADQGMVLPGTDQFNKTADSLKSLPIPRGAKFLDKSDLWAAEGQLTFSEVFNFSNIVNMIGGFQWKLNVLNSQGTLFADTAGSLKPYEYGGYLQLKKKLFDDLLTLTVAGRYDKHRNFEGRFTPRVTGVFQVAKDNFLRLSYQTAYRFPTNQNQYINLNVSSAILIGALPEFQTYYQLNTNPGYTAESITTYRTTRNPADLQKYDYKMIKPETVSSFEVGYKGVIGTKLLLDVYGYYATNKDFIATIAVGQSATGTPQGFLNPGTTNNFSYNQNTDQNVKTYGWGATAEYQLPGRYVAYGNIFSDKLSDVPPDFVAFFNAPLYRFNLGLRNETVWKNIGFNVVYKWQDVNQYEGTFVSGTLPAFGWLDAQVSYRFPKYKSMIRLGGTNVLNNYQRTGYGSPYVGGLYYISYGYNVF